MDDFLSGAETVEQAQKLQQDVSVALAGHKFPIRKWASNCPVIINNLPRAQRENIEAFEFGTGDHVIKTLGLSWYCMKDTFGFKVPQVDYFPVSAHEAKKRVRFKVMGKTNQRDPHQKLTRRAMLSDVAKIYDRLGLISPVTVTLKICLQDV